MKCSRCQRENPAGTKFCGQCAAPLASRCAACGAPNPPDNRFCGQCAASLRPATTPSISAPEAYTPRHLAEKILTSKGALEGERKQVTVLFADLKGSMELLADRDPEEARKLLDPVLERMMEAVHRFEGTVNQVMGDGIMALFGAPLAHEDHAVRACYAALRMHASVAGYAEGVFRTHGVPLQIRVGLNSGEVVVRAIGSDLHMDYTAIGQTTHLAGRMEQMAAPGTTLLAPATVQLAEGYVQVAARGPVAVKGMPDPLEVYELTGAHVQRSRVHAAAARGLTRFVGRDPEIEQLRRTLALAQEGRGQLVAVVGEPGVGKSRLVYEFTHSHRTQDWVVLEAGSVSYGKATSYLPVIDLLKAYFKVHDRDAHRDIREKVTGKLPNYRPEYQHDWGRKTYYTQLRLDALPPESAAELLQVLLGDDPGVGPLKRLLVRRGNPLFVEESVRTLVETGALAGERGAYRLTRPIQAIEVPATVQVILAARIDRLSPDDKQLLQTASVIGKDVPLVLLQRVVELTEAAVQHGLTHLQAAEFLYETRLFPDAEYTFKHALTHEVAYGSLLQDRRRELHTRAVAAIEGLYPERLAEHIEQLAHHALRGEAWEKAVTYLRQAGAKASARCAYREAAARCEQALAVLEHLPEGHARMEQAIDLHLDISKAQMSAGAQASGIEHARTAEALAEALGDARRLGWALLWDATGAFVVGDSDRALERSQRALAIGDDDVSLQTSVNHRLGMVWQMRGEYRTAAECLRRAADALRGGVLLELSFGASFGSASVFGRLAWCLVELGEFDEALACSEEAVRSARELNHPASLISGHRGVGLALLRRGDVQQSLSPLERAVELCRSIPVPLLFDITAGHLGYAYALSGRLPEGMALLEEALADPAATGTSNHSLLLAYLGEAHLLAGRRDDALVVARRALDLAHRQKERGNEAWVLRLLGEIAAQADPPDRESAEAQYGQALARASELGMRPFVAHCHLGLGQLFQRTNKPAAARKHLTTATATYREMGMTFWLEKAEAAGSALR